MRIIVTGGKGQLGLSLHDTIEEYNEKHDTGNVGIEAIYPDRDQLDISDPVGLERFFGENQADLVINCAAYTAVDKAEEKGERIKAWNANVTAVEHLGTLARRKGFRLINISSDYVFDGEANTPYMEGAVTHPLSVYGKTKACAENYLNLVMPDSIVVRTGWLYSRYGTNFFLTMMEKAKAYREARVVCDQKGTPTSASDLAAFLVMLAIRKEWRGGLYNFSGEGEATWYEFAREIYRLSGADPELVTPISTKQLGAPAPRPRYSVLDKTKTKETFGIDIPHWKDSLRTLAESLN